MVTMSQGHYRVEVERIQEKVIILELCFSVITDILFYVNLDCDKLSDNSESRTLQSRSKKVAGKGYVT